MPVIGSMLCNGGAFEQLRSIGSGHSAGGTGAAACGLLAYNGSQYSRVVLNTAANISGTTQANQLGIAAPGEWTENSSVAAAGTPSASKTAGAAGVRHVCRNLSISIANNGAAKTALITINLRDGAAGAGTIKRTWQFIVPAGDTINIDVADLNIFGTAATAMTLESAAALPADVSGVCSIGGYSA